MSTTKSYRPSAATQHARAFAGYTAETALVVAQVVRQGSVQLAKDGSEAIGRRRRRLR